MKMTDPSKVGKFHILLSQIVFMVFFDTSSIDLELNSSKLLKLKQVSVLIQYIFIVHVKIFVPLRAATYFILVQVYCDLNVQYGY